MAPKTFLSELLIYAATGQGDICIHEESATTHCEVFWVRTITARPCQLDVISVFYENYTFSFKHFRTRGV